MSDGSDAVEEFAERYPEERSIQVVLRPHGSEKVATCTRPRELELYIRHCRGCSAQKVLWACVSLESKLESILYFTRMGQEAL